MARAALSEWIGKCSNSLVVVSGPVVSSLSWVHILERKVNIYYAFGFVVCCVYFWTPAPFASLPNQGGEWKYRNEYGNQSSGRPWIYPQHLKFIYWRIEFCGDKYQFPSSPNLVVKVKFEGRTTFLACLFYRALINVDWLIICVFLTWCTLYCRSARGKSSISACKKEHSANKETLFAYFLAHQPTNHPSSEWWKC